MNKTHHYIYFFYPHGRHLMGQEVASRLILQVLSDRWIFKPHHIPVLDRKGKHKLWSFSKYMFKVLHLWAYIISLAFRNNIAVYLNLGQSWNSIFRDGVPFICFKLFRKDIPIVISLHGQWFAEWARASWKMRAFLKTLSIAKFVVVVSDNQKQLLVEYGLKKENIRVIPNTCDIQPLSDDLLKAKHISDGSVRILFLSNLIDSKGYKKFLGMLRLLKNFNCPGHIEATLCGNIMQAGFSEEPLETVENIEGLITELNNNDNISVAWIKGAYGKEKQELFRKSHIFVFPSRIEAQPIVLLEAMASGCAIISSKAGLIPSMLEEDAAVLIEDLRQEEIAKQTINLINNQQKRILLALTAMEGYKNMFSTSVYKKKWNDLFSELMA